MLTQQLERQMNTYFLADRGTTGAVDPNGIANIWTRPPALALCGYRRDASQRPLQGIPADAPFHLPEPKLPFN